APPQPRAEIRIGRHIVPAKVRDRTLDSGVALAQCLRCGELGRDLRNAGAIETIAVAIEHEFVVGDRIHAGSPGASSAARSFRTARKIACFAPLTLSDSAAEISSSERPS